MIDGTSHQQSMHENKMNVFRLSVGQRQSQRKGIRQPNHVALKLSCSIIRSMSNIGIINVYLVRGYYFVPVEAAESMPGFMVK